MHKTLARQLKKLGLSESSVPDLESWHAFVKSVSNCYEDADADRYRIERSMDISSNEMQDLNHKLQSAQDIANFGYWSHNLATGENSWSLKLFQLLDLDLTKKAPELSEIINLIHEDDRPVFENAVKAALEHGTPYDIQLRMHTFTQPDKFRWIQGICLPSQPIDGKYTLLSGVVIDITDRRNNELEIERLNSELIDTARRAGMSEVATSMLHNIGNVLNSANTTAELIKEELNHLIYERVISVTQLLTEHKNDLSDFISQDNTGKKLPEYLIALNERITYSNTHMKTEVASLINHLYHISEITSKHKSISGVSGVSEKIKLSQIVSDALSICALDIQHNHINIIKNFHHDPTINIDKHKLIQIAVNLVKNSIESLAFCTHIVEKNLTITTDIKKENNHEIILLSVEDNGLGIEAETLKNLFKFGFTTKKDGHGFGLHGSALTATELNASLSAHSDGRLKGARFTLAIEVPMTVGANQS